jgi:uncharacterized protein YfiM (DUF2279 family)
MRLLLTGILWVVISTLKAQVLHFDKIVDSAYTDTIIKRVIPNTLSAIEYRAFKVPPTPKQYKRNINKMKVVYPVAYGGILGGLSVAWYSNYEQSRLKSFNDAAEWLQVDKFGHMYGTYIFSKAATELWRSTGINEKKRLWYGGLSGLAFQSIVEVFDGYSAKWGFSWSDVGANVLGTGIFMLQEAYWKDQRIEIKMGFWGQGYDAVLQKRVRELYGTNVLEQFVKDYNKQTIWLSANVHDFFPKTKLPKWLNIAVGYGANGMLGANSNIWKDKQDNIYDYSAIKRVRQFYLAPDIKLTKIKVRKQWQRAALTILNAFKLPTPALQFNSNGKFVFHWLKM